MFNNAFNNLLLTIPWVQKTERFRDRVNNRSHRNLLEINIDFSKFLRLSFNTSNNNFYQTIRVIIAQGKLKTYWPYDILCTKEKYKSGIDDLQFNDQNSYCRTTLLLLFEMVFFCLGVIDH